MTRRRNPQTETPRSHRLDLAEKRSNRKDKSQVIAFTDSEGNPGRFRISYTGAFPADPEESYDPEADWNAWKLARTERRGGLFSAQPNPAPSDQAILAARTAALRGVSEPQSRTELSAESLTRAAAFTTYFGEAEIASAKVPVYRGDLLIDALNRYPHPAAAACRWLVPALRNLIGGERETPDELWDQWDRERDRIRRLSLHPWSTAFQGRLLPHNLIDYQAGAHGTALSRTHLEHWRLTAHLIDVPPIWRFERGFCSEPRRPLSVGRLNALIRFVKEALGSLDSDRQYTESVIQPLRSYLLRMAADDILPMKERRRFRDGFLVISEAFASGLVKRSTFHLEAHHIHEYDQLLMRLQMEWRNSENLEFKRRMKARRQYALQCGWQDSDRVTRLLGGRDIGLCSPREIAASLLCMNEGLALCHPQTFAASLAHARKLLESAWSPGPPRRRRGRPIKPPEFSPSTPHSG